MKKRKLVYGIFGVDTLGEPYVELLVTYYKGQARYDFRTQRDLDELWSMENFGQYLCGCCTCCGCMCDWNDLYDE